MSTDKYLVYPFPARGGLINLLMELEIRVGLAHLANRTLVSANKLPCWPQPDDHIYKRYRSAAVLDLFDIPIKHVSLTKLYKTGFDTLYELDWQGDCASEAYFCQDIAKFEPDVVDAFREQRQHRWSFPDNDADAWVAMKQQRTFCNYAYFFLAPEADRKKVRTIISRMQPKSPYLNLAKSIAKRFGRFNAIHVRRGDFKDWWVVKPTPQEIVKNIEQIMPSDEPLLILTDNSQEDEFFYPILRQYPNAIFLDDYLLTECQKELNDLPHQDATVVALLSLLIAVDSVNFAGSAFSTFSSYIHRRRSLRDNKAPIMFVSNPFGDAATLINCEFQPKTEGHFTWNQLALPHTAESRANAWFREWPEASR